MEFEFREPEETVDQGVTRLVKDNGALYRVERWADHAIVKVIGIRPRPHTHLVEFVEWTGRIGWIARNYDLPGLVDGNRYLYVSPDELIPWSVPCPMS